MHLFLSTLVLFSFAKSRITSAKDISIEWTLKNANGSLSISVKSQPCDVTLLVAKHLKIDPLYSDDDDKLRWIGLEEPFWTFTGTFNLPTTNTKINANASSFLLDMDGIDTSGSIMINGHTIMTKLDNAFVRKVEDMSSFIQYGANEIVLQLNSPVKTAITESEAFEKTYGYEVVPANAYSHDGTKHINMLRKMQASFGWDFGPSFPTLGFRQIKIQRVPGAKCQILSLSAEVEKIARGENSWKVHTSVSLHCKGAGTVVLRLELENKWKHSYKIRDANGPTVHKTHFTVDISDEQLWYPRGYGSQPIIDLKASIDDETDEINTIHLGFRHIELIEKPVDDNTAHGTTFYFKVNGKRMFLKGSNWVPRTSFSNTDGCQDLKSYFEAMKAAHFNALRVWGGGFYELDCFYDMADRYGILIWHDLMFACNLYPAHPNYTQLVSSEVTYQVNRLKSHPSILLFAGNNEVAMAISGSWYGFSSAKNRRDYFHLFNETIVPAIRKASKQALYIMSSPSNGAHSCVEDKQHCISPNPMNDLYGDIHYYDYNSDPWDWKSYPTPRCATEFGVQSWPNLATLEEALPKDQLHYDSPGLRHRQHRPTGTHEIDHLIRQRLRMPIGTKRSLANMIYASQLVQAMAMRTEVEHYRRHENRLLPDGRGGTSCALYWQLNDLWAAPSWASIDHAGRWKMLHYHATEFFAPLAVSALMSEANEFQVWIHAELENDRKTLGDKTVDLTVDFMALGSFAPLSSKSTQLQLRMGSNLAVSFNKTEIPDTTALVRIKLIDPGSKTLLAPEYTHFIINLKDVEPQDLVSPTLTGRPGLKPAVTEITITAAKPVPFVWLESDCPGIFSRNSFTITKSNTEVNFTLGTVALGACNKPKFSIRSLYNLYNTS